MTDSVFTMEHLSRTLEQLRAIAAPRLPSKVFVTDGALRVVPGEFNFPPSKHRSARIHKKLVKRFGSYEKKQPAIFEIGAILFVHPALWRQLEARCARGGEVGLHSAMFGIPVFGGAGW